MSDNYEAMAKNMLEWADKIDNRLGPISGSDADRAAHAFRRAATVIRILSEARTPWQKLSDMQPPYGRVVLFFIPTDIADDGTLRNWKKATGSLTQGSADTLPEYNIEGRWLEPWDSPPTHWQHLPSEPEPAISAPGVI